MKPFFDSAEKVSRLMGVADAWMGTPFVPNGAMRGVGVSCQQLAGRIYIESGFLGEDFLIPTGPMNWAHANTKSLIEPFMDSQKAFTGVDAPAQPGDLLGFRLGGCVHHCGVLVTADEFVHCLRGAGVQRGSLRDATFMKRLNRIWRPIV